MKKLLVVLLVCCFSLLVSTQLMADVPAAVSGDQAGLVSGSSASTGQPTATVILRATILPYAHIWFGQPAGMNVNYGLKGQPTGIPNVTADLNASQEVGSVAYNIEANCSLYGDAFLDPFSTIGPNGTEKIGAWFNVIPTDAVNTSNPHYVGTTGQTQLLGIIDYSYEVPVAPNAHVEDGNIYYQLDLGSTVSAHRAGDYATHCTLVVWNPTQLGTAPF